ncbi:MAG: glycosyltransferase family 9 protein [Bacteroidetes bacterium]|nr:glycosyltransferase family 9 protein [Bacteroidota bacterium]
MNRIIISRTDSIGDVVLTMPLCAWLREKFPETKLTFLGKNYTREVVECFDCINEFISLEEIEDLPIINRLNFIKSDVFIHVFPNKELAALAKKAKIPVRIGTSHRVYHLLTCNHRLNFSRKNSSLHESQLNFELAKPLGIKEIPSLKEINSYLTHFNIPKVDLPDFLSELDLSDTVILHPKSQGSAMEWPLENYFELAQRLADKGKTVCFTGTEVEGEQFRSQIPFNNRIIDTTGRLTLPQLIKLCALSEGLVACSTGPYHLSAVFGNKAIGLFSTRKPIHPGRWSALGENAVALVYDENCPKCKKGKKCNCIEKIEVDRVIRFFE